MSEPHDPAERRTVPFIEPEQLGGADERNRLAVAEARALEQGDYDKLRQRGEYRRSENFRNQLAKGVIACLWVAVFAIILMGGSWVYHLLTPAHLHYLTAEQLGEIKTVLFGGGVGAFVASYLRRMLS